MIGGSGDLNGLCLSQEDLLTFVDVRTLKVKHEEQFKFEVWCLLWRCGNYQVCFSAGVIVVCMCVCACVYVHVGVCMCVLCVCMCVVVSVCMCVCMCMLCVCACVCVHVCACVWL